jgi:hypothetical protein
MTATRITPRELTMETTRPGVVYRVLNNDPNDLPQADRGTTEHLAVKIDEQWIALLPVPETDSDTDEIGWVLDSTLDPYPSIREQFARTHRGWWVHDIQVIGVYGETPAEVVEAPSEQYDWAARVEQLQQAVDKLQDNLEQAHQKAIDAEALAESKVQELQAFKARVVEVGGRAAEDHDWCGTYEGIMAELGLPGRKRDFVIAVRCAFETTITVQARNQEEAEDEANDVATAYGWRPPSFFAGRSMTTPSDMSYAVRD